MYLKELEAKGLVRDLRREVRYTLHVNGVKVGSYILDHQFIWVKTAEPIYEDVKSKATVTALYRRNKKHMAAEYGIKVVEVYNAQDVVW